MQICSKCVSIEHYRWCGSPRGLPHSENDAFSLTCCRWSAVSACTRDSARPMMPRKGRHAIGSSDPPPSMAGATASHGCFMYRRLLLLQLIRG